jgi:N6-adenosine-specific RNA methylase IME4
MNRDDGANFFDRWLTLGNQLGGDEIYEEDLAVRIKARYVLLLVSCTEP